MKKNISITTRIPLTPNFIQTGSGNDNGILPISDFTEEELREIAAEWTEELIKKAKSKG